MGIIGVIGSGVMGCGITQTLLSYGYDVTLVDISVEILEKAEQNIEKNLRLQQMFSKQTAVNNANLKTTIVLEDLSNVDIVIESITENIDLKKEVYNKIDTICKPQCIIMSNTSCISITQIASFTSKEKNVIGTHFMNPVPLTKAVEVIKGYHTSEDTVKKTIDFINSIEKQSIVINDFPGFVSNRISHLMMNEAAFIVQDQIAEPKAVDSIFTKGYGHKMGPLETADLIGLDTVANSLDVLYESYRDPKFRCCPLLKKMVNAGLLGVKSGKGFYTY